MINISEKGAIFLIVFNFLYVAAWLTMWELISVNYPSFSSDPSLGIAVPVGAVMISSPVIGILSESYVGRYRVLTLSLYLWMFSITLSAIYLIFPSDTCLSFSFFATFFFR